MSAHRWESGIGETVVALKLTNQDQSNPVRVSEALARSG